MNGSESSSQGNENDYVPYPLECTSRTSDSGDPRSVRSRLGSSSSDYQISEGPALKRVDARYFSNDDLTYCQVTCSDDEDGCDICGICFDRCNLN